MAFVFSGLGTSSSAIRYLFRHGWSRAPSKPASQGLPVQTRAVLKTGVAVGDEKERGPLRKATAPAWGRRSMNESMVRISRMGEGVCDVNENSFRRFPKWETRRRDRGGSCRNSGMSRLTSTFPREDGRTVNVSVCVPTLASNRRTRTWGTKSDEIPEPPALGSRRSVDQ